MALACAGFPQYFKDHIEAILESACTLVDKTQEFKPSRIIFNKLVKDPLFLPLLSDSLHSNASSNLGAFLLGSVKLYFLEYSEFYSPLTTTFNEFIWRMPCALF